MPWCCFATTADAVTADAVIPIVMQGPQQQEEVEVTLQAEK